MLMGRQGQAIAVWGATPDGGARPRVEIAFASPLRGGFTGSFTQWPNALLSAAAVSSRDGTVYVALANATNNSGFGLGRRAYSGQTARTAVSATDRVTTLAIDPAGRALATTAAPALLVGAR